MKIDDRPFVVTIDGPSGSGKGSVALRVATELGFHLLDSGAIYRLAALKALRMSAQIENESSVLAALKTFEIRFEPGEESISAFLDNENVNNEIRTEQVGYAASVIAAYPAVRHVLLETQLQCFKAPGLVADGRDMGTVVFAQAKYKFYLFAAPEIRAQRRYKQLISMGISANIDQLRLEVSERDARDRNREVAPLVPAIDAIVIDSSLLDLDQVTELVMSHIRND